MMLIVFTLVCFLSFTKVYGESTPYTLQSHEQWWQEYAGSIGFWPNLDFWSKNFHTKSHITMRNYVKEKQYKTFLDAGCGVGTDYFGFIYDKIPITYQGLEITPKLVEFCQRNTVPIVHASIENIPFEDSSFDITYARHILEHLSYYHTAIQELIRVARFETLIVFFIPPDRSPDSLKLVCARDFLLYNNYYNKKNLEEYCKSIEKVSHISWQKINATECFLHIYLK